MKPALLLIDLQDDYLRLNGIEPPPGALIAQAARLLHGCRAQHIPVIHIWTTVSPENDRRLPHWKRDHRWMCVAGTSGHQSPAPLRPVNGEKIVHKSGFNSFAGGELGTALRELNCDTVVLAGLHLHACVRTAAVECLERGFRVLLAEDVLASNDPIHSAATRRWLADRCARFAPAQAILSELNGGAAGALTHHSPRHTGQSLFEVTVCGRPEITAAGGAAKEALSRWQRRDLPSRHALFEEFARRLEASAPELARQMAIEIGKPLAHALEEIRRATANVRDVLSRAAVFQSKVQEAAGLVCHRPLGVVALISPWNNPVAIPVGKIAPALMYGNAVIWKPAPAATNISRFIMRLLHESGFPPDAVQFLSGDHTTAQSLAACADVQAVTFTGSVRAGYAIQEICARRMVPLQAELGGNNAAIVWDDADLPHAAGQIAWGAFGFAGQRCTANRRAVVHTACFDKFLAELKAAADRLPWGDPLEKETEVGPVISEAKCEEHAQLLADARVDARKCQVELARNGSSCKRLSQPGAYAEPAIVSCSEPDHSLVQEESMSPFLVLQRADDFEQALSLTNGVRHGLAAALFSHNSSLREKFLAEARSGILRLNSSTAGADMRLPFGGWKASGIGPPEHGIGDALFYTRIQTVYGAVPSPNKA